MLARTIEFPLKGDNDGWLGALEVGKDVPFDIRRVYYIFGTQAAIVRGKHAHHTLQQLMVCLAGRCTVLLDDGKRREEVLLAAPLTPTHNAPQQGLFIDPMVWHEMYEFSSDCVLLVLADGGYDLADYIRDYDAFKALSGNAS